MDFGEDIFNMSKEFPRDELFNLTSQIRRASDSIALNIAEGSTGQSYPEFVKFVGYSLRSLAEVVTCLHKAFRGGYLSQEPFNSMYQKSFTLMNSIAAFRNFLKSNIKKKE